MTQAVLCRAIAAVALGLALSACVQGPKPLYLWEDFPRQQYTALQHEGKSPEEQIRQMEAVAVKARGAAAALPPGFRAHLGLLYLGTGNADRARELWLGEKEAFPESSPYMDHLLKRLDAPAKDARKGSPA